MLFSKRITYIIDPQGIVVAVYPNVDPAGHAIELLKDIKELQSK
jgi:peroxiredoxin